MGRLPSGGDPSAAYRCWMCGADILHSPFIVPAVSALGEFPPTLEALCSQHPCPPWQLQVPVHSMDRAEVSSFRQGQGLEMARTIIDRPCVPVATLGAQWKHRMWRPHSRYDSICEGQGDVVWKYWSLCFSPGGDDPGSRVFKCRWHLA